MKTLLAPVLLLALTVGKYAQASEDLNCVLKQRGATEAKIAMVEDTKNFSYKANLGTVSAEVSYYFDAGSNKKFIEQMVLTDSQTGVSAFFGHNVECAHNECPTERLVDIQTGWQQLNLGARGIFQVWCTLNPR